MKTVNHGVGIPYVRRDVQLPQNPPYERRVGGNGIPILDDEFLSGNDSKDESYGENIPHLHHRSRAPPKLGSKSSNRT
ncbi:hypothetical protein M407DRAFT_245243 [Tulasnella calospora MUT 4182]|uniref:Uncharacterized protein n=1 Tax=Tulasnella calospora MUT 4182 TaxID=1051891 RepID=A0A0C3Q1Q1_9AGAM|nr:hypothetical protein M407DRAFT_245243 [Tulasnella calospora MUT 4182]